MPTKGEKYYVISSLIKGLRVMELLAEHGELGVTAVAGHLQTNRAGCHRFLMTLRDLGYVEKTEGGRYRLTFKLVELGMKKLDQFEIRHIAHPYMQELSRAFGETVNLGHWTGKAIAHLDKIDSREILRIDSGLGTRAPAYCTGLGKSILAFLPMDERDEYLENVVFEALTPNTFTSVDALMEELARIQVDGFAVDNEELSIGLRCVAAPVFDYSDRPSYALSISGPIHRLSDDRIESIKRLLMSVSARLSKEIGARGIRRPTRADAASQGALEENIS
jgi:DNA-binding IclR family transcriptional regulator